MARINLKPLDDRIVVEQHEADEVTAGGIVLPTKAQEKPTRGTCVAAGPGKLLESGCRGQLSVKIGDEVFYGKYSGTEVEYNGKKFTVLHEGDVLAIID
jgi:chaperonin GroES